MLAYFLISISKKNSLVPSQSIYQSHYFFIGAIIFLTWLIPLAKVRLNTDFNLGHLLIFHWFQTWISFTHILPYHILFSFSTLRKHQLSQFFFCFQCGTSCPRCGIINNFLIKILLINSPRLLITMDLILNNFFKINFTFWFFFIIITGLPSV